MLNILIPVAIVAVTIALLLVSRAWVTARPDEWLLVFRSGQLQQATIGARALRIPGSNYVRFTSALQRVTFSVHARSKEHVQVQLEGFLLWTVGEEDDQPYRAYQSLGITNLLSAERAQLLSDKHLLARPQHKAFQQLVCATVQRYAAGEPLDALLGSQDQIVAQLHERLSEATKSTSVRIDQIQLLSIQANDPEVRDQLSAALSAQLKEKATQEQQAVFERMERAKLERELRLSNEAAKARASQLSFEDEQKLAQERRRLELAKAQTEIAEQTAALKAKAQLAQLNAEQKVSAAKLEAELAPEKLRLAAQLEAKRQSAQVEREVIELIATAEAQKTPAVREDQRARAMGEQLVQAVAALPLKEAKWTTVGAQAPLTAVAEMIRETSLALKGKEGA